MRLAKLVLDIETQALDKAYTYLIPDHLDSLEVGCCVLVPFGHRPALAWVIEIFDALDYAGCQTEALDISKLKCIERQLSPSYFSTDQAACALWMAEEYLAPLISCVRLYIPTLIRPKLKRTSSGWDLVEPEKPQVDERWVYPGPNLEDFDPKPHAIKQQAICDAVRLGPQRLGDLRANLGSIASSVSSLEAKGVIILKDQRRWRVDGLNSSGEAPALQSPLMLTPEQASALEVIEEAIARAAGLGGHTLLQTPHVADSASSVAASSVATNLLQVSQTCGSEVLIEGVTGSGKTEVYLQAIDKVLRQGQSALVLVPEIALTPQTLGRFRARFGHKVALLHSRMSDGERFDQWELISSTSSCVVLGARSALFAPVKNLGLIIIDEAHESSYKQESAPRYDARSLARHMAKTQGICVLLGSATPRIEDWYKAQNTEQSLFVQLTKRANNKPMPPIEVVNMAQEFKGGWRSMFSRPLTKALIECLKARHKAVLLLNQRGFAQFMLCRDCGFVPSCNSCASTLTLHEADQNLKCHHCGYTQTMPARCPKCNSVYLKRFGAGTQRVEAALQELLHSEGMDVPVVRMDADTTARKGSHERLLSQFAAASSAVLLGTQMVAKGLDFPDVTLVGVVNADTQLRLPDFRAQERTFALVEQVAGRAGRSDLGGKVIVQSYDPQSPAIWCAANYRQDIFVKQELEKRQTLGFPPFVRMANILLWGSDETTVAQEAQSLYARLEEEKFRQWGDGWMLYPPTPCVLSRLRGQFRYHILIKAPAKAELGKLLAPVLRTRKANKQVNCAIDIDPVSLL